MPDSYGAVQILSHASRQNDLYVNYHINAIQPLKHKHPYLHMTHKDSQQSSLDLELQ